MLKIGIKDLAKYPFLTEAGEYLANTGLSLEQLSHPDWKPIVEKAYGRIVVASSGQIYGSDLESQDNDSELLSFIVADNLAQVSRNCYTNQKIFSGRG